MTAFSLQDLPLHWGVGSVKYIWYCYRRLHTLKYNVCNMSYMCSTYTEFPYHPFQMNSELLITRREGVLGLKS